MITQTINLNLIPGSPQPRINVSQYDNGSRTLQFNLYNGVSPYEIPSGASVSIVGTKADNTGFEYACTFDGSLVSVNITDQMTVFAGEVQSELQIRQSGEVLGTANFIINVERAALSDDTQISETDIPIIQRIPEILEEAEGYADTAHKWATFGADTETPSSTNNAKYWAEQSQVYATGALHWKGSVAFANIPTSGMIVGDFYNITNDFTTDSRFDEGAGIKCAAGTNIVWDTNNKWDILTPSTVASQVKYDRTTSGLSATNVQSAIDELDAETIRSRGRTTETDANTIIKPGIYWCDPSVTANLPSTLWGILEVMNTSASNGNYPLTQKYIVVSELGNKYYYRTYMYVSPSYVWSDWQTYESANEMYKYNGIMGAKNLIPYPHYETTKTVNGITFTDNGDGTVTANGTATATAVYLLVSNTKNIPFQRGNYFLSGCPLGGGSNSYILYYQPYSGGQFGTASIDNGNGVNVSIGDEEKCVLIIRVYSGATLSNLIFKPMLRLAEDVDETFRPYAMTNKELTDRAGNIETKMGTSDISAIGDGTVTGGISQLNSDLSMYDNFDYTYISESNFTYGDTSNAFTIPNDTLLVRVRFWFDGNADPLLCYLNFDRRIPRLIQIAEHYHIAMSSNIMMTVEVNWRTMTTTIVSNSLPNSNWHIGIQFYK